MNQVSPILRKTTIGWAHWCPACEQQHPLPDSWRFSGDVNKPTFTPSFKQNFILNKQGKVIDAICHYIITDGKIQFCTDSWHGRSDIVAMPIIPEHLTKSG